MPGPALPPERRNATRLPATTIDETIEGLGVDRVDFIRMDIEGSERHALRGARRTIAKHKPDMAITVYHRIDDPQVIPAVVVGIGPDYAVVPGPLPAGGARQTGHAGLLPARHICPARRHR